MIWIDNVSYNVYNNEYRYFEIWKNWRHVTTRKLPTTSIPTQNSHIITNRMLCRRRLRYITLLLCPSQYVLSVITTHTRIIHHAHRDHGATTTSYCCVAERNCCWSHSDDRGWTNVKGSNPNGDEGTGSVAEAETFPSSFWHAHSMVMFAHCDDKPAETHNAAKSFLVMASWDRIQWEGMLEACQMIVSGRWGRVCVCGDLCRSWSVHLSDQPSPFLRIRADHRQVVLDGRKGGGGSNGVWSLCWLFQVIKVVDVWTAVTYLAEWWYRIHQIYVGAVLQHICNPLNSKDFILGKNW